jgi:hypothetical protein
VADRSGADRARAVNEAYRDAQQRVTAAAADPEVISRSRIQAEAVLIRFFSAAGWSIAVRWDDIPSGSSIRQLSDVEDRLPAREFRAAPKAVWRNCLGERP